MCAVWQTVSVWRNLFKADNFYIFLCVAPYSWLVCISPEKPRGNWRKEKRKKNRQGTLNPHFTLGSTADKNLKVKRSRSARRRPKGGTVTQADRQQRRWRGGGQERRKSLHRAPGRLKAFSDRTAERGITLPNEQAQSRGISLCSGCIVAAAACSPPPVCSLRGLGARRLHSYSQNIFWSSLNSPQCLCSRAAVRRATQVWRGGGREDGRWRGSRKFQIFTCCSIFHLSSLCGSGG